MEPLPPPIWPRPRDYSTALPIAVPDLAEAARLLDRPLPEVERAAGQIRPYIHQDGRPFWSLHLLSRELGVNLAKVQAARSARAAAEARPRSRRIRRPGPGPVPRLSHEEAEAAADLAEEIGTIAAAEQYDVGRSTLNRAWRHYGIEGPWPAAGWPRTAELPARAPRSLANESAWSHLQRCLV
jgi:hypothetical protein